MGILNRFGVPCQFDRWCTSADRCVPSLPEEIDPEAFRVFLDKGPEIPVQKIVRFSLTPEIHSYVEGEGMTGGIKDSRGIGDDCDFDGELCDWTDGSAVSLCLDRFWQGLEGEWTSEPVIDEDNNDHQPIVPPPRSKSRTPPGQISVDDEDMQSWSFDAADGCSPNCSGKKLSFTFPWKPDHCRK